MECSDIRNVEGQKSFLAKQICVFSVRKEKPLEDVVRYAQIASSCISLDDFSWEYLTEELFWKLSTLIKVLKSFDFNEERGYTL
jgi:hypothetical protein